MNGVSEQVKQLMWSWVNERVKFFPAIEGIFQQSMFSLLYGRGRYYASSEIVQKVQIQKQVKEKKKQAIEA